MSEASNYITKTPIYKSAESFITSVNGRINDLTARHPKRATITALALAALTISLLAAGIYFKCTPFYVATAITASITAICLKKLHAHQQQRLKEQIEAGRDDPSRLERKGLVKQPDERDWGLD